KPPMATKGHEFCLRLIQNTSAPPLPRSLLRPTGEREYSRLPSGRLVLIRVQARSFVVHNLSQAVQGTLQLPSGNGQRWREADDIGVLAFGQEDEPAVQHGFDGLQRDLAGGRTVRLAQLQAGQQAQPAAGA